MTYARRSSFDPLNRGWAADVLVFLAAGPQRFNRILYGIEGISDRHLTTRLRDLEETGLVVRNIISTRPFQVEYGLSEKGVLVAEALKRAAGALALPGPTKVIVHRDGDPRNHELSNLRVVSR